MVRNIVAFAIAVMVAITLASVASSLFAQEGWSIAAGQANGDGPAVIALPERISWILHDLVGMETNPLPFGAAILGALLIGFSTASLISRFVGMRTLSYALAGAVAIFVMYAAVKYTQSTVGVSGARTALGMAVQMSTGLIAGLVFALISRPRSA